MIDLKVEGAVGDGLTDNYAVIQGVINAAPYGSQLYLPAGDYRTTNTLDFGEKGLRLVGDGQGREGPYIGGSRVSGSVRGPLLQCNYPATGSGYSDLRVVNLHAAGIGMLVGGINIALDRLAVDAFRGITGPDSTYMLGIRQVVVRCAIAAVPLGSIGIQIVGHTSIQAADVVGFDQGIRVAGPGNGIRDIRLEVNRVGLILGMNADGNWGVNATVAESLSLEANDIGIQIRVANCSSLRGILIQGSVNSPSGQSAIGILVENATDTSFENVTVVGDHSVAAIRERGGGNREMWRNVTATNTHHAGLVLDRKPGAVRWGGFA